MKPLVIYHYPCQDGFTAAWACWLAHPDWEFVPAKYGDPPADVAGRDVYLLDFSYKRPVLEDLLSRAKSVTILDHHKTAEADLAGLGLPGVFDMNKSGARLAWEFFHPGKKIPELVKIVEDRDLWRFMYEETKNISAALFAEEYSFITWSMWSLRLEDETKWACERGEAILRKQAKDIKELLQNKFRTNIAGHNVWAANLPYTLASDAANILAQGEPFGVTFFLDGTSAVFSLRSTNEGVDVSEIAKQFGGGGHKHAAGFKLPYTPVNPAAIQYFTLKETA
jgi:oligoribonuclease NrnB/cAMP/cGMP phosphodiesterase (DHH superfamily)